MYQLDDKEVLMVDGGGDGGWTVQVGAGGGGSVSDLFDSIKSWFAFSF